MKKILNHLEEYICFLVSLALLLLTFANVISRYLIHASISFTDEITTNLFVLLSIMGTALAVKRGAHLGLSIVTDALPKKYAELIAALASLIGVAVGVVLFYTGMMMVKNQIMNGVVSITLMIPAATYGIFLPTGMAFVIWRFAQQALLHFSNFRRIKVGGNPSCATDVLPS